MIKSKKVQHICAGLSQTGNKPVAFLVARFMWAESLRESLLLKAFFVVNSNISSERAKSVSPGHGPG